MRPARGLFKSTEVMPRGLPRPLSKGLPVPYEALLVEEDGAVVADFAHTHERRDRRCRQEELCHVCGIKLEEEVACVGHSFGGGFEAWLAELLHTRCAKLTLAHCPHIKEAYEKGEACIMAAPLASWRSLTPYARENGRVPEDAIMLVEPKPRVSARA